jgi:hypothetical protein
MVAGLPEPPPHFVLAYHRRIAPPAAARVSNREDNTPKGKRRLFGTVHTPSLTERTHHMQLRARPTRRQVARRVARTRDSSEVCQSFIMCTTFLQNYVYKSFTLIRVLFSML